MGIFREKDEFVPRGTWGNVKKGRITGFGWAVIIGGCLLVIGSCSDASKRANNHPTPINYEQVR